MAYIQGTANNPDDLFEILIAFAVTNDWELLRRDKIGVDMEDEWDGVYLKGKDVSGNGEIFAHIQYGKNTINAWYSFLFEGFTIYDPTLTAAGMGLQVGSSYSSGTSLTNNIGPRMPLHRNPIDYWFMVNSRRIMGAVRFNDSWGSFYLGYVIPYVASTQWPVPFFVGSDNLTTNYHTTTTNGCFWGASAVASGALRSYDGYWYTTPLAGNINGRGAGFYTWPWTYTPINNINNNRVFVVDSDGVENYCMLPLILSSNKVNTYGVYGEFDGVYYTTAYGASGGDILQVRGNIGEYENLNGDYLIVQRDKSSSVNTAIAMKME